MSIVKMPAYQLSNLWEIKELPSGAGVMVLFNRGRPLYQLGFSLSGVGVYQSDAELSSIYEKLMALANTLPIGTRVRMVHTVDGNFKDALDAFDRELEDQTLKPHSRFFLEQNRAHLQKLVAQRTVLRRQIVVLMTFDPSSLANARTNFITQLALKGVDWCYTALGGASTYEQILADEMCKQLVKVEEFRQLVWQLLRRTGLDAVILSRWQLWRMAYERTHPNTVKRQGVPAYPEKWSEDERSTSEKRREPLYETPRELLYSQEPVFAPDRVEIDGSFVGAVTLRSKPKEGIFPLTMLPLLRFRFDCEVVVDLTIEEQGQARGQLALLENTIIANINSNKIVADVDQAEKLDEVRDAKVRIGRRGERVIRAGIAVLPKAESLGELDKYCNEIETTFTNMSEAVGQRERHLAWQIFTQTASDSSTPIFRRRKHTTSRAVVLLPVNAPARGDRKPMMSLVCPTGDLYNFDPFDGSNPNFNGGVMALSGHGKSQIVLQLLVAACIRGALITILDIGVVEGGGSYRSFCDLVGGSYQQFGSGRNSINPLELPTELILGEFDEEDFGNPEDPYAPLTPAQIYLRVREYTKSVLYTMIVGNQQDNENEQIIVGKLSEALSSFYSDSVIRSRINAAHRGGMGSAAWRRYPLLEDFIGYIQGPEEDRVAELMRLVLRGTYCRGLESAIFNRPSNIPLDAEVLIFDFKDVPRSFFDAVVTAANGAAIRRSYRRSSRPKMVVIDEGGVLIKRKHTAEQIAEFYATGRKSNISAWFIAQDYGQAMDSPSWPSIKANMGNIFLGQILPSTRATVQKQLELPEEIALELVGKDFERNRLEGYSPWLHIKGGTRFEAVQNRPPIELLWLGANDPAENTIKQRYIQAVGDSYLALRLLALDYPQLAEGGKQNSYLEGYLKRYLEEKNRAVAIP